MTKTTTKCFGWVNKTIILRVENFIKLIWDQIQEIKQKEERIQSLVELSNKTNNLKEQYRLNNAIFEEYQFYSFNEALQYIEKNIAIGKKLNNNLLQDEANEQQHNALNDLMDICLMKVDHVKCHDLIL